MSFLKHSVVALVCLFVVQPALGMKLDPKKSKIEWVGEKVTGKHNGSVALKSGELDLKKGKGEFVVDMQSITVEDLTGDLKTKLTNHLKSDDFFSVEKNKTAKLTLDSIKKVGPAKFDATGKLTVKGITKPATLSFEEKNKTYSGELTFDRTHYDIKFRSGSFFENLGDKLIKDPVLLKFKLVPAKR